MIKKMPFTIIFFNFILFTLEYFAIMVSLPRRKNIAINLNYYGEKCYKKNATR